MMEMKLVNGEIVVKCPKCGKECIGLGGLSSHYRKFHEKWTSKLRLESFYLPKKVLDEITFLCKQKFISSKSEFYRIAIFDYLMRIGNLFNLNNQRCFQCGLEFINGETASFISGKGFRCNDCKDGISGEKS